MTEAYEAAAEIRDAITQLGRMLDERLGDLAPRADPPLVLKLTSVEDEAPVYVIWSLVSGLARYTGETWICSQGEASEHFHVTETPEQILDLVGARVVEVETYTEGPRP